MMKSQNHFSQFVVLELVVMVRMIEFIQMILVMLGLWWRVIDFFEEIQILIDFIRLFFIALASTDNSVLGFSHQISANSLFIP